MSSTHGTVDAGQGASLYYTIDNYTDPWREPETIVLVHGLAESGHAWLAWVPHLAREYRVVRIDQRGFGRSSAMPEDYPWTLDGLGDDLARLIDSVGGGPVHLVGAKIGATVAAHFAASHPSMLRTLTLIGLPLTASKTRPGLPPREYGVRAWARSSMKERLGSDAPPAMVEWWSDLMGATPLSTLLGFSDAVSGFSVVADLPLIACPVLALTSDSARHPVSATLDWRATVLNSEMVIIPGDGYHAAATHADKCAQATLAFIRRHGADRH